MENKKLNEQELEQVTGGAVIPLKSKNPLNQTRTFAYSCKCGNIFSVTVPWPSIPSSSAVCPECNGTADLVI